MAITLNGTTGITTPDVTSDGLTVDSTTLVVDEVNNQVGIGTSSPSNTLEVKSSTNDNGIRLSNSVGSYYHLVRSNGDGLLFDADAGNTGGAGADIRFQVKGSERARITSAGDLLVGTTSQLTVSGVTSAHSLTTGTEGRWTMSAQNNSSSSAWGIAVKYANSSPNNTSQNFFWATDSGDTNRFNIRSNGGVANYQANNANLSDRREKTNFAPAGEYLSKICAISVQTFNYIDQNMEEDPGLTLGVVAQDVQAVAPELVTESNWGTEENPKMRLSVYQTDLQYALMKCIQEQQAIIEALTARVSALEAA